MPETNPEDQRPSDVEASHQPNEGSSQRHPSLGGEPRTYQGQGGEASGRDRTLDYGDGPDPATADATPEDATLERDEEIEPEIAADDAGASAAAEMLGKARLREH